MKLVVFTDLDATLLDSETYSWEAAREGLLALKERNAAIVLVSSKTFPEMKTLHGSLNLEDPFVVENGGGIFFRKGTPLISAFPPEIHQQACDYEGYLMLPLGVGYQDLVSALDDISTELGIRVTGFSSMTDREVADLTGLSLQEASKARVRLFDEPFVIQESTAESRSALQDMAAAGGLTAVQGGRFWHLIGHKGKGEAVALLMDAYRDLHGETYTVGLGDSPNDFPFLERVDVPVLVSATVNTEHLPKTSFPVRLTSRPGPEGWNDAVLDILGALPEEPC